MYTSAFPPLPPAPDANIHSLMFGRPDQAEWDHTIHIDDRSGRKRGFKELQEQIALGATALGAPVSEGGLGLNGDGDEIIGVLGFNSLLYVDLVFSLLRITTPLALISSYSTRYELVHALKLTKATRLFVDAKLLKNVLSALEDPDVHLSADKIYILGGRPAKGRKSLAQMKDSVQRKKVPLEPVRPAKPDTLAYLVMSSGTSGLPKSVMITHGNLIASFYSAIITAQTAEPFSPPQRVEAKTSTPVTLAALPMFHSYGLHAYILRSTIFPATYVILERWNTAYYLKCIPKYQVTHLTLVPSMIHQLVNHPDIKTTDLSSVVVANSGAAYLPPELATRMSGFMDKSADLSQGYGLSEGTLAALVRPLEGMLGMGKPPPHVTGILHPGLDARIVRADGSDAPPGEQGELWLRGRTVAAGYWNNPPANEATFGGGWLKTGDQFRADEKGYFFFADRGKDTLKVSGSQVSPKEIEDALFAQPDKLISDVAVAGVSGGRTDDEKVPRAWIVLSAAGKRKGTKATIEALEAWHKEVLSSYKWLRGGIEVVKEIPKTPTGKTIRRALQDQYEQRKAKQAKAKL